MIDSFAGEYRFLSNFWACSVWFEGKYYPSSEHAYQAAKTQDESIRDYIAELKAGQAKRFGKELKLRKDWEFVKDYMMLQILRDKFSTENSELRKLLYHTGHQELIEGNTWGDTYWGVCNGVGENKLGKMLMLVREELNAT